MDRPRATREGASGGGNAFRCDAIFDPVLQSGQGIEFVRCRASTAVRHAWDKKQTGDTASFFLPAIGGKELLIVFDQIRCGKDRIAEALIKNEFSAMGCEGAQIGAGGVVDLIGIIHLSRDTVKIHMLEIQAWNLRMNEVAA